MGDAEMVAHRRVLAGQDDVAEAFGVAGDFSFSCLGEVQGRGDGGEGAGHVQAQDEAVAGGDAGLAGMGGEMAANSGVERAAIGRVRRRGMGGGGGFGGLPLDVGAGAEAGIEQAAGQQAVQHGLVFGAVGGLDSHRAVPVQAEPGQVLLDRVGEFRAASGGVDILDPQEEAAARRVRPAPCEERRMGVAEMEVAGRAGGEAGDDGHGVMPSVPLGAGKWERQMITLDGPRFGPRSGGAAKQLVVLCHGLGADGQDLIDLAPTWAKSLPDAAFVAPDAPEECDLSPFGRQWFSVADRSPPMREAGVRSAATALDAFLDAELARLGLPADAYALMGFSQGAMTVLFTGLRRPVAPRAILAYSGGLIAAETLGAELCHRPPVLLVHGEDDPVVLPSHSQEAADALVAHGVPVDLNFRPFLEHGIDETGIELGAAALRKGFGL